jgi:hypothetical protein
MQVVLASEPYRPHHRILSGRSSSMSFFFFFFCRRDTTTLCVSICLSRWCQNNVLLYGYDHIHLNLDHLDIKGLSSACDTRRFLHQSQNTRHHDVAATGDVNSSDSTFDLFSSLTIWCFRCDCGGVKIYLIDYIFCIIDYHICQDRYYVLYTIICIWRCLAHQTFLIYMYRLRGTIQYIQPLCIIYFSYNLVVNS